MPVFKSITLGCKVNQYETEYVRQSLLGAGFREAAGDEPADLCIVNTCTVTLESDYKGRKIIRALARENPRTEIVVMGCYATRAPGEVASLPRVVHVLTDKQRLAQLVRELAHVEPPSGISSYDRLHRACVKVQDGCTKECSYCIVPKVRPLPVSRPMDEVVEEIRRLVDGGHREIVLTGIHLGCYGAELSRSDGPHVDLVVLLRAIIALEGEFRVRLSSLEAAEIMPELLRLMAEFPERICPHLHIPLQSGSNAVLARMKRRSTAEEFLAQCEQIRLGFPVPALTTDVIVGFPGESEADFEDTCRVVKEARFAKVHVFRFSAREGTPAATMPDQISPPVKQHRAEVLGKISRQLRQAFCASLIGQDLQVVAETLMDGRPAMLSGTADRYVTVRFPGGPELMNQIVRVTAASVVDDCILATSARGYLRPPAECQTHRSTELPQ
jgi:threonylcarbamoyladenosine tRNA methylthiotransferase MtaB